MAEQRIMLSVSAYQYGAQQAGEYSQAAEASEGVVQAVLNLPVD